MSYQAFCESVELTKKLLASRNELKAKLVDKRDCSDFPMVNCPFICRNIRPANITYDLINHIFFPTEFLV